MKYFFLQTGNIKSHQEIAEFLIRCGAKISTRDISGQTALHVAARKGRAGNIPVLLAAGSRVHEKDGSGQSSMHLASAYDYSGIINDNSDCGSNTFCL